MRVRTPSIRHALHPVVATALLACATPATAQSPEHIYLTWRDDPTRTITINAQTDSTVQDVRVRWARIDEAAAAEGMDATRFDRESTGSAHRIPGLPDGRWVHWIDLTGLEPGAAYGFVVGSDTFGWSAPRAFRTIPADPEASIRFLSGGDMGVSEEVRVLNAVGATREPLFGIIGGDISYADGLLENIDVWDAWLRDWGRTMVTPEGFTLPMVLAAGNHEVQGGYGGGGPDRSPFFFGFFAQPEARSWFRMRFGPNIALYTLDTGHVVPHRVQVDSLEAWMTEDQDVPARFALYHIPLFPSHRPYDGELSTLGRTEWLPVFDAYGLTAAFENHDHTFKRTHRMRGGQPHPEGTLYLGDGAWGRGDRPIDVTPREYLRKAGATRHVWVVDVHPEGVEYRAYDVEGRVIDVFPESLPDAEAADRYFATLDQQWQLRPGALERLDGPEPRWRMTNRESLPLEARVELEVAEAPAPGTAAGPPATTRAPVLEGLRLAPGESAEFTLEVPNPVAGEDVWRAVRTTLSFTVPDAPVRSVELRTPLVDETDRTIERGAPVTLDGRVEEWGSPTAEMFAPAPADEFFAPGWEGVEDASASLHMRRSRDALFFAVEVRDDRVIGGAPESVYDGDALLFWLDPLPGGEFDDDPYLGISAPIEDGRAPVVVTDADWLVFAESVEAQAVSTPDGWSVEMRVPIELLDGAPAFRVNFGLVDRDSPSEELDYLHWRPRWEETWDAPGWSVVRVGG